MKHIEDIEQEALIQWANYYMIIVKGVNGKKRTGRLSDWLFAIPNGGKRYAREAKRLKAMGVKSGVSDLFLPIPYGGYIGLWIELKKSKNAFRCPSEAKRAVTDSQSEWLDLMRFTGFQGVVCYGFDDAKYEITRYLSDEQY